MKILNLPGGGGAGYAVTNYLTKVEQELGHHPLKHVDLVAGVSTGAIIGTALAYDMSAQQVQDFYLDLVPRLFKKRWPWNGWWKSARYSTQVLEEALRKQLPVRWCELGRRVMVYATEVSPVIRPCHWKSWRVDHTDQAADVILASAAAPVYFKPRELNGRVYVDGGVVNYDPLMDAVAEALALGERLDDIEVLTLAPYGGEYSVPDAAKLGGALSWIPHMPLMFTEVDPMGSVYRGRQLLGERLTNVVFNTQTAMDDGSSAALQQMGDNAVKRWADIEQREKVLNFLS